MLNMVYRRYLKGAFDEVRPLAKSSVSHLTRTQNIAPTLLETYEQEMMLASMDIHLTFYDTSGMQDHPAVQGQRRVAFAQADLILLCFSVETSYALDNIELKVGRHHNHWDMQC
jgi:hypothetical protein